ncbi:MAG: transcriptional repressor [Clostridium sp.]|jgi:Fur family ferric uptake transcriptional regulator|nr:transcriptional repressor [Clostridium sp.]
MSNRPANYNTKQGEVILSFLEANQNTELTATGIAKHFETSEVKVGRTTVYRQLEKLIREGSVRKYIVDGMLGACFQFVPESERNQDIYHMKCENCGKVIHVQCGLLENVSQHILDSHHFQINDSKTVFYGKCDTCLELN